jgi:hypothetical protein
MGGATLAAAIAGTVGGTGAGVFDFTSGSGTIVIPSGATGAVIEVWGGGGGGGWGTRSDFDLEPIEWFGGGGGGGAYVKKTLTLVSGDAGKTISYVVGAPGTGGTFGSETGNPGGQSVAFPGTFTLGELLATGGQGGQSGFAGGGQGAGGIASGGDTNTNGNGGAAFSLVGASGIVGDNNLTAGAGGDGGLAAPGGRDGEIGKSGRVRFVFTF